MPTAVAHARGGDDPESAWRLAAATETEAARRLNINRQLLYTKMQRYGLGGGDVSENPTPAVGKDDD